MAATSSLTGEHLSTVTHEMRTPLTAIKASLALIRERDGELPDGVYKLLAVCERNTDRLLGLVNALLDLTHIEGAPARALEPVGLAEIAEEVAAELAPLARQQGVLLTTQVPHDLVVSAEPDGIRRILVNLLGNALKFTPGGRVEVSAMGNNLAATLQVQDDGIGIASERLSSLFDRFAHVRRSRAQQGTGLGLAITRALVERYGGTITVTSALGRGTCFTIVLPAAPVERREAVSAGEDRSILAA